MSVQTEQGRTLERLDVRYEVGVRVSGFDENSNVFSSLYLIYIYNVLLNTINSCLSKCS